ncbi:MAG: Dyp-type peroxidase [Pseudomonadota bacterium]|nr:Dyp-type peroxidase [Pseudomonadota bacterium]
MANAQPGILEAVPVVARYVSFAIAADSLAPAALPESLKRLAQAADGRKIVVGLGPGLVAALGASVPSLHEFPSLSGNGVEVPSTPIALWCWLRGDDRGDLLHLSRRLARLLEPAFKVRHVMDAFRHKTGHDLTGYEDGTENPKGEPAEEAALVHGAGAGLDGSSHLAVQQWVHDFDAFELLADADRDNHFGRRLTDNVELEDSPNWAHVKRTAQESFEPAAFMLRRSMPWTLNMQSGLMFVAFGTTHRAFEVQMRRMAGLDDGVVDAMFRISKPVNGAYLWCPPVAGGALDLRQLGL